MSVPAFLLLIPAGEALAHVHHFGVIEVVHPVIVEPAEGVNSTCARLTIINHGSSAEYLVGLSTAAASVRIVATSGDRQEQGLLPHIAIEPGARVELKEPAWCIFLSGITSQLTADVDEIPGTLMFENQGKVEIEFMVVPSVQRR